MTEKYIDLTGAIIEELHLTESEASGADAAMRWLQMRPSQVPGRTITHSRVGKAMSGRSWDYKAGVLAGLALADTKQVPDPEPTNAEKLEALYDQWLESDAPACRVSFHQFMDDAGVKAPGGDK